MDDYKEWFRIARSNFILGSSYHKILDNEIRFEELCFELQQCVEKSYKAILIYNEIVFPKTHSIDKLIDLLNKNNIAVPEYLFESAKFTDYAVQSRYPDEYEEIDEQEYNEAVRIAENVYSWAKEQIK